MMCKIKLLFISLLLCSSALYSQEMVGQLSRGVGSITYKEYAPLAEKPITLHYYIPTEGNVKKMPILFAFHGADRDGTKAIKCWQEFAEVDKFIVLAPEFSKEYYDENAYQFGNVFVSTKNHTLNPEEIWSYSLIEPIFEFIKGELSNKSKEYSLYGHSAGGQFVHRYLLAKPKAKVDVAVASNPGSWTWISKDGVINNSKTSFEWPYTVKGTPFSSEEYLKAYLERDMVVHLGQIDTATSGPHIRNNKPSLAQGKYRFDRGQKYFKATKKLAKEYGLNCRWEMVIVNGVGHNGMGMVYARTTTDENGKKVYSYKTTNNTSAYSIIFGERYK